MKLYYNIEIQMSGTNEMTDAVLEHAAHLFGFLKKDVEDAETYNASVMFTSDIKPSDMRERVRNLLVAVPTIHYVDVIYRFEYAMVPDRFVIWSDGRTQEYTGYINFREDV